MLCKFMNLKVFYIHIVVFFQTTIACLFLLSCSGKDDNENKEPIFCTPNSINSGLEFGYIDTNNVFHSAPIHLYDSTTTIDDFFKMRPVVMRITIRKPNFLDKETELCAVDKMLWSVWNGIPVLRASSVFIDENCKELHFNDMYDYDRRDYFFLSKETDSTYIFTSQHFNQYGEPMERHTLFVDHRYSNEIWEDWKTMLNNTLIDPRIIKIIPASSSGHFRLNIDVPDSLTCIDNGGLRREIIEINVNFRS